ncbi:MAG: hypothetical protein HY617_02520 [Candidatus Sungbacteria bacterium]|nr:hypothetical protein [Candidatus Sungbacteria bacterium]
MAKTKKKFYHIDIGISLPWVALGLVSLICVANTVILTNAFSKEIDGYINPKNQLLISEKTGRAWVEIDFDGKQKRLFESNLGSYHYELAAVLAQIAKTAHFSFKMKQGEIEELAGISAGETRSWRVYRYDTRINQPIDQITVSGNDYYRIKLEP